MTKDDFIKKAKAWGYDDEEINSIIELHIELSGADESKLAYETIPLVQKDVD